MPGKIKFTRFWPGHFGAHVDPGPICSQIAFEPWARFGPGPVWAPLAQPWDPGPRVISDFANFEWFPSETIMIFVAPVTYRRPHLLGEI